MAAYAFAENNTLMQKPSGHVKETIYAQVILETNNRVHMLRTSGDR